MKKRTDSIVAVTLARFATIYVEADSPEEAMKIVGDNLDKIEDAHFSELNDQFEESETEVHSCEAYTTEADDYMDYIWVDGEFWSYDEYVEALDEQDESNETTD